LEVTTFGIEVLCPYRWFHTFYNTVVNVKIIST
jgi:hypothetical protein